MKWFWKNYWFILSFLFGIGYILKILNGQDGSLEMTSGLMCLGFHQILQEKNDD